RERAHPPRPSVGRDNASREWQEIRNAKFSWETKQKCRMQRMRQRMAGANCHAIDAGTHGRLVFLGVIGCTLDILACLLDFLASRFRRIVDLLAGTFCRTFF